MALKGGLGAWIKVVIGAGLIALGHYAHTALYQLERGVRTKEELIQAVVALYEMFGRETTVYGSVSLGLAFLLWGGISMVMMRKS